MTTTNCPVLESLNDIDFSIDALIANRNQEPIVQTGPAYEQGWTTQYNQGWTSYFENEGDENPYTNIAWFNEWNRGYQDAKEFNEGR